VGVRIPWTKGHDSEKVQIVYLPLIP